MPRRPRKPARYSTSFRYHPRWFRGQAPMVFIWALPTHLASRSCNRFIGSPIYEVKPYLYVVQTDDTDGAGSIPRKFGVEPVQGFSELRRANADADFESDAHGTCSFQHWYAGRKVRIPAFWPEPPMAVLQFCTVPYSSVVGQVGFRLIETNLSTSPLAVLPARKLR